MRRTFPAGCVLAPMMIVAVAAADSVIVENADLLFLEGPGQVAAVTGTVVYSVQDSQAGTWRSLLTRQQGSTSIEVTAEPGQYQAEVWSVPANPSSPMRSHSTMVIDFGDTGPELVDALHLLELLDAWGSCSGPCPWDLNGDGVVDALDLLMLLDAWGQPVPWYTQPASAGEPLEEPSQSPGDEPLDGTASPGPTVEAATPGNPPGHSNGRSNR